MDAASNVFAARSSGVAPVTSIRVASRGPRRARGTRQQLELHVRVRALREDLLDELMALVLSVDARSGRRPSD